MARFLARIAAAGAIVAILVVVSLVVFLTILGAPILIWQRVSEERLIRRAQDLTSRHRAMESARWRMEVARQHKPRGGGQGS